MDGAPGTCEKSPGASWLDEGSVIFVHVEPPSVVRQTPAPGPGTTRIGNSRRGKVGIAVFQHRGDDGGRVDDRKV